MAMGRPKAIYGSITPRRVLYNPIPVSIMNRGVITEFTVISKPRVKAPIKNLLLLNPNFVRAKPAAKENNTVNKVENPEYMTLFLKALKRLPY